MAKVLSLLLELALCPTGQNAAQGLDLGGRVLQAGTGKDKTGIEQTTESDFVEVVPADDLQRDRVLALTVHGIRQVELERLDAPPPPLPMYFPITLLQKWPPTRKSGRHLDHGQRGSRHPLQMIDQILHRDGQQLAILTGLALRAAERNILAAQSEPWWQSPPGKSK